MVALRDLGGGKRSAGGGPSGRIGLSWANDPVSGLIGMMMTQNSGFYAAAPFADFWVPANAALAR